MMFLPGLLPSQLSLDTTAFVGISLWSLALYLGFSPLSDRIAEALTRWFGEAERSLYTSEKAYEDTRPVRESLNSLYGSVFSIVPFIVVGSLCNYGITLGLGQSWTVSVGILACIACGVYELGRRDGQASR
jgi:hypothetical protein